MFDLFDYNAFVLELFSRHGHEGKVLAPYRLVPVLRRWMGAGG